MDLLNFLKDMGKSKLQKAEIRYTTAQAAFKKATENLLMNPQGQKEIKAHNDTQANVKKEHLEVQKLTDEKAAADKAVADKKIADDKAATDKKAADDKLAAERKEADDKAAIEKAAKEEGLPEAYLQRQKVFEEFSKEKKAKVAIITAKMQEITILSILLNFSCLLNVK